MVAHQHQSLKRIQSMKSHVAMAPSPAPAVWPSFGIDLRLRRMTAADAAGSMGALARRAALGRRGLGDCEGNRHLPGCQATCRIKVETVINQPSTQYSLAN